MHSSETYAIGLMSGTSLDGLDLVFVKFKYGNSYQFEILSQETVKYSKEWRSKLKNGIHTKDKGLEVLDIEYGAFLGMQVNEFIRKNNIRKVDFIASHGHTILHQPEKGITYQIGNLPALGIRLRHHVKTVVCDFRVQDVKLGGQGAPLVPIGDELLFSEYDYCLNLGGFANVSFHKDGKRIAYDVCPVNIVLNKYAKQLGFAYDDKGNLAKSGEYLLSLGSALHNLSYYKQKPPK